MPAGYTPPPPRPISFFPVHLKSQPHNPGTIYQGSLRRFLFPFLVWLRSRSRSWLLTIAISNISLWLMDYCSQEIQGRPCVICPYHKYKITLDNGEGLYHSYDPKDLRKPPKLRSKGVKQRTHHAKINGNDVYVALSDYYSSSAYKAAMSLLSWMMPPPLPSTEISKKNHTTGWISIYMWYRTDNLPALLYPALFLPHRTLTIPTYLTLSYITVGHIPPYSTLSCPTVPYPTVSRFTYPTSYPTPPCCKLRFLTGFRDFLELRIISCCSRTHLENCDFQSSCYHSNKTSRKTYSAWINVFNSDNTSRWRCLLVFD